MFGDHFRFKAGEQPKGLGVALEPAHMGGELVQSTFAVMSKGRMPQVMREASSINYVWIASEHPAHFAPDLGDFKGMSETGTHEIVRIRVHDLGFSA